MRRCVTARRFRMTFAPQDEVIAMTVSGDSVAHALHHGFAVALGGRE
jgi:hypothetical protein